MASTFTSSAVASGIQARAGIGYTEVVGTYALTAALVISDVIQMVKVPAGATVTKVILSSDDLDTNGTPLITLDVGDGDDTDRYIVASTIAQAGGVANLSAKTGVAKNYTAEDTIDVIVSAAPATGATSGTIKLIVGYTMQQTVS